jgi:hypothetical protein
MKLLLRLLFFSLFIISCNEKKSHEKKANITSKIHVLLNQWHEDAAKANFTNYFEAMDTVSFFIGTDASENWNKNQFKEFSKPYFDRGKAWSFKMIDRNIYISKDAQVVWFDELLDTWMGTCRGSGIFEKNKDSWKIKHYVLSVAIPNDDIQQVILAKKKKDSLFLKNFKQKTN